MMRRSSKCGSSFRLDGGNDAAHTGIDVALGIKLVDVMQLFSETGQALLVADDAYLDRAQQLSNPIIRVG